MSRIDSRQLFSILLLSGAWSIICLPQLYGGGQLFGVAAACGVQVLLCLPLFLKNAPQTAEVLHYKWLGWAFAIFFVLWGGRSLLLLHQAVPPQLLDDPGHLTAAILLLLTCLYTGTAGLKATARCAPLMLVLLGISAAVLVVGAWKRMDAGRLTLRGGGFREGFSAYAALSGELPAAWVLLRRCKEKAGKAIGGYLLGKLLLCLLLLVLCMTAGGRLTAEADYPVFTLTMLSQPLQGQRADSLYILAFVMLCVMHLTLLTGVTAHLLEQMYPKIRAAAAWALTVMLLLACMLPENCLAAAAALVPVLLLAAPVTAVVQKLQRRAAA